MKKTITYIILFSLLLSSCSQQDDELTLSGDAIKIAVAGNDEVYSRAMLYNEYDDILAENDFTLNAYIDNSSNLCYLEDAWVSFFNGNWRFRHDATNLIDFYWPNDSKVNFTAYIPRDLTQSVGSISNIAFTNENGFTFKSELPAVINDRTAEERVAENNKKEFIYASRLDQAKKDGTVFLRFAHPFAMVKFRILQSHRGLKIHSITLNGLSRKGTFTNNVDTNEQYKDGQSSMTYTTWSETDASESMTINIEKSVPDDINYGGLIGGPYTVIPQLITDVKLKLNYSWDKTTNGDTEEIPIKTSEISAWQPGMVYTYTLDLGDNKEEILFSVKVEAWVKGEDEGEENIIDVK